MNMNATAQMVTTTQVGCGHAMDQDDTELVREIGEESAVESRLRKYVVIQMTYSTWEKLQLRYRELCNHGSAYAVPPHTMTNRGHLRDIG